MQKTSWWCSVAHHPPTIQQHRYGKSESRQKETLQEESSRLCSRGRVAGKGQEGAEGRPRSTGGGKEPGGGVQRGSACLARIFAWEQSSGLRARREEMKTRSPEWTWRRSTDSAQRSLLLSCPFEDRNGPQSRGGRALAAHVAQISAGAPSRLRPAAWGHEADRATGSWAIARFGGSHEAE